ncbi:MAG TPA: DUF4328 domain-containing protein [Candidatus Binatia bacterium]|nr:DUF4328 domain-containing protein [Candidatus Binatia bacterium]
MRAPKKSVGAAAVDGVPVMAEPPVPVAESPVPVAEAPLPVAESPMPVSEPPVPVAEPPQQALALPPVSATEATAPEAPPIPPVDVAASAAIAGPIDAPAPPVAPLPPEASTDPTSTPPPPTPIRVVLPTPPLPREPPPAYLWEAASQTVVGTYQSARARAFITVVLFGVLAAVHLVAAGHRVFDLLAKDGLMATQRTAAQASAFDDQTVSIAQVGLGLSLLLFIAFLAWESRSVDNLRPLALASPVPPASPAMSIVWWLIPVANLVMPLVVVLDLHRRVSGGRRAWLVLGWWLTTLAGIGIVAAVYLRSGHVAAAVDLRVAVGSVSGSISLVTEQVLIGAFAIGEVVLALASVFGLLLVRRVQAGAGRRARAVAAAATAEATVATDADHADDADDAADPPGLLEATAPVPVLAADDTDTQPVALPAGAPLVALPMGDGADIPTEVAN